MYIIILYIVILLYSPHSDRVYSPSRPTDTIIKEAKKKIQSRKQATEVDDTGSGPSEPASSNDLIPNRAESAALSCNWARE